MGLPSRRACFRVYVYVGRDWIDVTHQPTWTIFAAFAIAEIWDYIILTESPCQSSIVSQTPEYVVLNVSDLRPINRTVRHGLILRGIVLFQVWSNAWGLVSGFSCEFWVSAGKNWGERRVYCLFVLSIL